DLAQRADGSGHGYGYGENSAEQFAKTDHYQR
ncbi:MAG: hypothetical protein ACI92Z_001521, partial [Paracoccaceae bacterium]